MTSASTQLAQQSVTHLVGVGPRVAERLAHLGISSVQDLLFHLPLRYQDRTRVTPIGTLREGDEVLVQGRLLAVRVSAGRRRSLRASVQDASGVLGVRLFHFTDSQRAALRSGDTLRCFGEIRRARDGFEMVHPEYRVYSSGELPRLADRLTPIYSSTEGIAQPMLRRLTDQALLALDRYGIEELLPAAILDHFHFPTLAQALHTVHRPTPDVSLETLNTQGHPALNRLAFEELLAQQVVLKQLRRALDDNPAPVVRIEGALRQQFLQRLPFAPTAAQMRVDAEIRADLARPHPMHRLVQGDVGAGKTLLAALAALDVVEAGYQAAVMAPTEILAEQHLETFQQWFAPLDISVCWLSGKLNASAKRQVLEHIEQGHAQVVVGTHALFQDKVAFRHLALMVVDEQHRFGVDQRLTLRNKGRSELGLPHQLIMTATPIPRTLSMTAYADLDTSVIDQLPPGRSPVDTVVVPDARRSEVVARVHAACQEGQQCYWVCTLIDESEVLEAQAAEETRNELHDALSGLSVGMVHGRMKAPEKDAVMRAFKHGELHVLVATTVVEVGVDVPNASLMIIENAERLGLSQLHQLRGRVGRGQRKSACVMLYRSPLSDTARSRLEVMRATHDGFEVAQADLDLRGPGEILGTRQTGLTRMKIANLLRDRALIPRAARAAEMILRHHPDAVAGLVSRWIGDDVNYVHV